MGWGESLISQDTDLVASTNLLHYMRLGVSGTLSFCSLLAHEPTLASVLACLEVLCNQTSLTATITELQTAQHLKIALDYVCPLFISWFFRLRVLKENLAQITASVSLIPFFLTAPKFNQSSYIEVDSNHNREPKAYSLPISTHKLRNQGKSLLNLGLSV